MAFRWKDLMIDVLPEGRWAAGCNVGSCVAPSQMNSDCPNPSCASPACAKGSCKGSAPAPKPKPTKGYHAGSAAPGADLLALRRELSERIERV